MLEMLKPLIEKAFYSIILNRLLWIGATLTASLGVSAPDEEWSTKTAAWITAIAMAVVAWLWSKYKDTAMKNIEPPVEVKK